MTQCWQCDKVKRCLFDNPDMNIDMPACMGKFERVNSMKHGRQSDGVALTNGPTLGEYHRKGEYPFHHNRRAKL